MQGDDGECGQRVSECGGHGTSMARIQMHVYKVEPGTTDLGSVLGEYTDQQVGALSLLSCTVVS